MFIIVKGGENGKLKDGGRMNIYYKLLYSFEYFLDEKNELLAIGKMAERFLPERETAFEFKRNNLKKRMSTGKFTQDELKKFADLMGCEYASEIRLNNGMVLADGNYKYIERTGIVPMDLKTRADIMRKSVGMKQGELLDAVGMTQLPVYLKRMKAERFSLDDLEKLAAACGATYRCYYRFDDGKIFE